MWITRLFVDFLSTGPLSERVVTGKAPPMAESTYEYIRPDSAGSGGDPSSGQLWILVVDNGRRQIPEWKVAHHLGQWVLL